MSNKTYQITVDELVIDVVRKDIKHLRLSVYPPDGRVRVAVPLRVGDDAVRMAVVTRMAWIKRHQARFAGQARQSPRAYVSGESHYHLGQCYLLNVIEHDGPPRITIPNNITIDLTVRTGSDVAQRARVMHEWQRRQLKALIPPLIAQYEPVMGVQVAEWGVKQMKTRWGTCNTRARRIWLNLALIQKPAICLEYVVVHEMAHLLERHHNANFWGYMTRFMPQWRVYRETLNRAPVGYPEWGY